MKETKEEFRARVQAQGLDHLVGRIVLNADSKYAAHEFLQACHHGALKDEDFSLDDFLDRLLPRLAQLEWLPVDLVPTMIRRFAWPDTAEGIAAASGLRADVRELLERHVAEIRLANAHAPIVPKRVDRNMAIATWALAGLVVFVIVGKILMRMSMP